MQLRLPRVQDDNPELPQGEGDDPRPYRGGEGEGRRRGREVKSVKCKV